DGMREVGRGSTARLFGRRGVPDRGAGGAVALGEPALGTRSLALAEVRRQADGLADAVAQVVEPGATRLAARLDLDVLYPGTVQGEGALDALASDEAAHHEGPPQAFAVDLEHRAGEH